jgi:hypothetical protein
VTGVLDRASRPGKNVFIDAADSRLEGDTDSEPRCAVASVGAEFGACGLHRVRGGSSLAHLGFRWLQL